MKHVAIVTVNFHNETETIECIKSFSKIDTRGIKMDFFIVDNESSQKSHAALTKQLSKSTIISSPKNLGFADGCNLGIRKAMSIKSDYVLLINPDSYIENKSFLHDMIKVNADIVSPLIKYINNGQESYDYGGKVDWVFGRNSHIVTQDVQFTSEKPDYFTGACLLIKCRVFKKVHGLDDGYFLYYEDADFCLRAASAGFSLRLCPSAILFHHLSTTTSKLGKRKIKIIADSHWRFCRKHLPFLSFPFYLTFNLYLRFKEIIY